MVMVRTMIEVGWLGGMYDRRTTDMTILIDEYWQACLVHGCFFVFKLVLVRRWVYLSFAFSCFSLDLIYHSHVYKEFSRFWKLS